MPVSAIIPFTEPIAFPETPQGKYRSFRNLWMFLKFRRMQTDAPNFPARKATSFSTTETIGEP